MIPRGNACSGSSFKLLVLRYCSGNPLNRLSESPDDGRLPPLPPAVAAGSSVTSAADASIAAQFPLPQLQQDPQAGIHIPRPFSPIDLTFYCRKSQYRLRQRPARRPQLSHPHGRRAQVPPLPLFASSLVTLFRNPAAESPVKDWRSTVPKHVPKANTRNWLRSTFPLPHPCPAYFNS